MGRGVPIDGNALAELRLVRLMSQERLAHACNERAGDEGCDVTREEISAYERGRVSPSVQNLRCIAAVLDLTRAEVRALVRTPTLDAAVSNETADEEDDADRRTASKIVALGGLAAALAAIDARERIMGQGNRTVDSGLIADHEGLAAVLSDAYCTTRPDVLARPVLAHASCIGTLLERPISGRDLPRLQRLAVGVYAQAGILSFFSGGSVTARRWFGEASLVAEEANDDTLRARVFGVSSILYSPVPRGGIDGDFTRSITLLTHAIRCGQRADPHTRAWTRRWLALELAVAGDEQGFRANMAQAFTLPCEGDDRGFFAPGVFNASSPEQVAANLGSGLVALGLADEALHVLAEASTTTAKWQSVATINTAAAFALINEPKQACTALLTALSYGMDVQRIRGVRARFPRQWNSLTCVRELDERIVIA